MTKANYFVLALSALSWLISIPVWDTPYLYLYQTLVPVESCPRCPSRGAENRILYPPDDIAYLPVNILIVTGRIWND
ncbi:uncharacterized protein P174DRAFT_154278 [Aspergillus novofumigatus IBT 16806]|uniref:Uncharacterized protein n=1 Tax=Aspergillus novofumigatus (strain IBT 16806) TaxID=1392255 RepID=A0A2I1CEU2_ASPN1|nr:uncharacterized protein P174DRAFT_154278 [Aspergillus novofumigatus IBT 16806]PKX96153.1 hypothetical protein P174DRAFT_154278 [Aspergillus novofumigatus IBT 16806]